MQPNVPAVPSENTVCAAGHGYMRDQEHTRQMTFQEDVTSKYPVTAFI